MIAFEMKDPPYSGRLNRTGATNRGTIRAARADDAPSILAVINRTNKAFYRAIIPADRYREPFIDLRDVKEELDRMTFYVYQENDRIVAVIALEARIEAIGVISRLYVLPSAQRRGIGRALLSHAERSAKEDGLRETIVWTDPKAVWAVSFYKRQRYHEIRAGTTFEDPHIDARARQHPETLLVLRKRL